MVGTLVDRGREGFAASVSVPDVSNDHPNTQPTITTAVDGTRSYQEPVVTALLLYAHSVALGQRRCMASVQTW